jgi:diguanylate cyclase (GGDEF)-like protein
MPDFQSAFVDFYAALLLLVLLFIILLRKDHYTFDQRVFLSMILGTIVLLVGEGSTYLVNGVPGAFSRFLNIGLNYVLFLVTPLLATLWANYLDIKTMQSIGRLRHLFYHHYILIAGWAMVLVNPFYPILFEVDAQNNYERQPGTYLMMFILLGVGIYYSIVTLAKRRQLGRRRVNGLFALMLLPAIGGLLQMAFYGFTSLFSMMALALMTAYIVLENIGVNTDALTGLFTRAKVYPYLDALLQQQRSFGVVLLDMDNLKEINDQTGHRAGDEALVALSNAIRMQEGTGGFIARMGGDEFLVVSMETNVELWTQRIESIRHDLQTRTPHDVRFSWGMSIATTDQSKDVDALLHEADERMYMDKAINKNRQRRRTDLKEE